MNDIICRATTVEESELLRTSYMEIAEAYNPGRPIHDRFYILDESDSDPNVTIRYMRPLLNNDDAGAAMVAFIAASDIVACNRVFNSLQKETHAEAPILLAEVKKISIDNLKTCK